MAKVAKKKTSKKKAGSTRKGARTAGARGGALRADGAPVVGILTGSPSDLPVVLKARDTLHELGIPCDVRVLSAHRTPEQTVQYVSRAREHGIEVLIACAGMAAHLAGVVAAHTTLPVIGVPLASGALQGVDALLSTVQMPPGIPVATVGVDGSRNAAFLAARILAATHPEVRERLDARLATDRERYDAPDTAVPSQAVATYEKASKKRR
ncbi:MAG: 5-(carboxyamino)imidazole ribonucleotide mutase [Myxococcota bacterium]